MLKFSNHFMRIIGMNRIQLVVPLVVKIEHAPLVVLPPPSLNGSNVLDTMFLPKSTVVSKSFYPRFSINTRTRKKHYFFIHFLFLFSIMYFLYSGVHFFVLPLFPIPFLLPISPILIFSFVLSFMFFLFVSLILSFVFFDNL